MTLFVRIVDGEVESIGPLPAISERLDTLDKVDPRDWLAATGYWRLETFDVTRVPGLTPAQQTEIAAYVAEFVEAVESSRLMLADARRLWEVAKTRGQAYNEHPNWSPPSLDPPPTGAASLALHNQQITYLYNRVQELNRLLIGDGTTNGPGVLDILYRAIVALRDLWEQAIEEEVS
jgi:hypothetical protein